VDTGILAACWSPDDTLLTLTTSTLTSGLQNMNIDNMVHLDENVILMTSTFDVLSELPLETSEFGEGSY